MWVASQLLSPRPWSATTSVNGAPSWTWYALAWSDVCCIHSPQQCTSHALTLCCLLAQYFPKDRALNRRKNFCFVTFATLQVRHTE